MPYAIASLLGLQGLIVVCVSHHFEVVYLFVILRRKTADCPHCTKRTKAIHGYQPPQMVKHILVGEKQLYLVLHKRRFFCPRCRKAFVEVLPGLTKWSRHTTALTDEILLRLKETSFAAVTRTTNLTYREQAKTLLTKVNPATPDWERVKQPFVLGLDEQSFSGHDMLTTITDLTHHKLLCVLDNDKKITLTTFFDSIPEDVVPLIQAICTDMRVSYDTARKHHPHLQDIPLIIDKYHLIADANKRVNQERLVLEEMVLHHKKKLPRTLLLKAKERLSEKDRERLKRLLSTYPDLATYYALKEGVRKIYDQGDKATATIYLDNLTRLMYAQREKGTSDWAKTLERFREPILNYYDFQITNAFTEGVHTKCKLIKRQGFGFRNKQVYLRKLMLGFIPFTMLLPPHFMQ
jgi:transposase